MALDNGDQRALRLIRTLDRDLSEGERASLIRWASRLLEIRESAVPALRKARLAVASTARAKVILPIVRRLAGALKDAIWQDRSWSARLGLGAAAITAATFGSKGAGIAALGTAVGLPLWMVLGAGGSFAGMIVDELSRTRDRGPGPASESEPLEEAEWSFLPETPPESLPVPGERKGPAREPLRRVFRRAYREARQRQGRGEEPSQERK